jgi:hypothetical protein
VHTEASSQLKGSSYQSKNIINMKQQSQILRNSMGFHKVRDLTSSEKGTQENTVDRQDEIQSSIPQHKASGHF